MTNCILLGSQITADCNCSHEIKRGFLLKRKAMINLDSTLKIRDFTLLIKVHLIKAIVFPVVMYRCESSIINKAKHWRTHTFEFWSWRRLLRIPWTARRSNQWILKEMNSWIFTRGTNAEAEAPILWPIGVKSWLIGKNPDAGIDWGQEEERMTEDEMARWHHWLNGHELE